MASNPQAQPQPTASNVNHEGLPSDMPPPYSAVVGNQPYGFVVPPGEGYVPTEGVPAGMYPYPKSYTAPGVYPHPTAPMTAVNITEAGDMRQPPPGVAMGLVVPMPNVGSEPTTVTCYNCNKVVTTRVTYATAWHTHLVAGSVCVLTMFCSLCCLGLVPYCFDTFKDAEHYCPNCNTFIGKCNKC